MRKVLLLVFIILFLPQNMCGAKSLSNADDKKEETVNQIIQINKSFETDEDDSDLEDIEKTYYGINPADKKQDLAKKYEALTIELKLEKKNAEEKFQERQTKIFHLEAQQNTGYSDFYTENMLWDTSRNFLNIYYQNEKNQALIPGIINSSFLMKKIGPSTDIYYGQKGLGSFDDVNIDFIKANATTYDVGAKLINKGEFLNFTAGAYNSTLNTNVSGGAALATNYFNIPKVSGSFLVGSGFYANELDNVSKNTGGLFGQYKYDRLKLNAQLSQSQYSNVNSTETGLYFIPEFQLTESLSIKTRLIKNISQDTNQDELGLSYKPLKNNPRNMEIEMYAGNTYKDSELNRQRIRFSAKFKI